MPEKRHKKRKKLNKIKKTHDWHKLRHQVFEPVVTDAEGNPVRLRLTGQEYIERVNQILTKQMRKMYDWMNGTEEYTDMFLLKDAKGEQIYFTEGAYQRNQEQADLPKFLKFINNKLEKGEDIPIEIGVTNINRLIKQFQYEQAAGTEQQAYIGKRPIQDVGQMPFESYYPHITFDKAGAQRAMMGKIEKIYRKYEAGHMTEKAFNAQIQRTIIQHNQITGDWEMAEMKDWHLYDDVRSHLDNIADRMTDDHKMNYTAAASVRSAQQRSLHLPGWTYEPRAIDKYIRAVAGGFNRGIGQIVSRSRLEDWLKKKRPEYGEDLALAYERFFNIYINNSSGYPSILPKAYLEDPLLNLKGTMYAWWADDNVQRKINKIVEKLDLDKRDIPDKFKGIDLKMIRNIL